MASHRPFHHPLRPITSVSVSRIVIRHLPGNPNLGRLLIGSLRLRCALGKGGLTRQKREGDGKTPIGRFALRKLWLRSKTGQRPRCGLAMRLTSQDDGWCDAPLHRSYNKPVILPFMASHERMWRDDSLYDYVVEIGWNDQPIRRGRGSAIFLHLARSGYTPTEGCIALAKADMLKLLPLIGLRTRIDIA